MSGLRRQWRNLIYRRILHADDTPHRIALGVAVGLFVAFTPLLGFQMLIALSLAALIRANKTVTIPMVWITNPVTALPIYGSCWWLGRWILTGSFSGDPSQFESILGVPPEYSGLGALTHLHEAEFWKYLAGLILSLGVELWVGCLVAGVVSAAIGYFVSRRVIIVYRRRRAARKLRKKLIRPTIHTLPAGRAEHKRAYAD
ncbi:MAG: DUF2062 domain-containing protein [Phycisphaerae bacterium]|nr:DUF2062 domain-containing protein [Phycisphaerae bacterium]